MSLIHITATALALAAPDAPDAPVTPATPALTVAETTPAPTPGQTDILGRDTFTVLADFRLAAANGERSFVDGGFGKTRFGGTSAGGYKAYAVPAEVDLVWNPRFTGSLSANVSAAYQRNGENAVDLLEAFVNWLPPQSSAVGVSARAGLMWPEISLEHSTGGAWSVVNTITPSAINSWVGEEIKVLGLEATLHVSAGQHQFAATGAAFGFNDTAGTLLSFRGWALQDIKATGFGHFPLPPLNPFISLLQQNETKSSIDIDHKIGFYGRLEWRPPVPVVVSAFYYDNRGNPQAFTPAGQWGWRTRFWNLGLNADVAPKTTVLAQVMSGSTIMGFAIGGVAWVHTDYTSAYVAVTQHLTDKFALTGRAEMFDTREHGSEMSPLESEDGWALTAAGRWTISSHFTFLAEALTVSSRRGTRARLGLDPYQSQTVFQASLRVRL